ncbi:pentatricopeptide repeat-containing protein At1g66345, mitochondrial [Vicia villosa]|uniref:pentatricopeptide repeat-containing protein At1g66345, mitochondrial n=1 Tax=Vicia villosa TaxID=3911 RepID=UPI00273C3CC5|nr:pentatricopeptide repeat-containing protein At1g66345, mitochondrial [Vicia villosa]XP_058724133.1 pentatricopeptide repeat-containing protein At1g66345, mitochondrial [Vicia villosa]
MSFNSKPIKLLTRLTFYKPHSHTPPFISSTSKPNNNNNNNIVTSICNSFRTKQNWDTITQKFTSIQLTNPLVEQILSQLKTPTDAKNALSFFHWSSKTHRFQHTLQSYSITINLLLHANLITDAKALLQSLANQNTDSDSVRAVVDSLIHTSEFVSSGSHPPVLDLLVKAYAKSRLTEAAFAVCCYVDELGFCIGLSSFNNLLHVAMKCDRFSTVWEVYGYMIVKRIYPNNVTLRIMIDVICKEGLLQRNVDVVDRIIGKQNSNSPSVVVNSSLILRMLENEKGEGELVKLVTLLKRLLQKNLISDSVAYSLIVHVKVRLGDLDCALEMYGEMVRRGFSENSFVYTSFIEAFCEKGKIEEAIGLMREMEGKGLRPYGETYECVIVGCADTGRLKECWSVFEEMLSAGLVPSCLLFDKVAEKVGENGDVEKVNDVLTVLLDKGFLPSGVTYTHLINGYARNDKVQDVLKIYYEMEYKSMCPGLSVYSSMIQCLCRFGKVEDAEKYLRIMKGRSLVPNVTIYETLIAGHLQKGNHDRALQLRKEMASLGLQHC